MMVDLKEYLSGVKESYPAVADQECKCLGRPITSNLILPWYYTDELE